MSSDIAYRQWAENMKVTSPGDSIVTHMGSPSELSRDSCGHSAFTVLSTRQAPQCVFSSRWPKEGSNAFHLLLSQQYHHS
ncbi:hypothetical protein P7K49_039503, partial [Saguinus oedipus]